MRAVWLISLMLVGCDDSVKVTGDVADSIACSGVRVQIHNTSSKTVSRTCYSVSIYERGRSTDLANASEHCSDQILAPGESVLDCVNPKVTKQPEDPVVSVRRTRVDWQ